MNFGAFVEILPGKEGLVHISELDRYRVNRVEDVVSVCDQVQVKVTEIEIEGRINMSRKALLPNDGPPRGDGGGDGADSRENRDSRPPFRRGDNPRRQTGDHYSRGGYRRN